MYCYMPVGPYITYIIVTCLWGMISLRNKPCIRIRYTTGSYINTYAFNFWVPTVSLLCFKQLWNSQFCSCCRGNCKELLAVKKVAHIFFFLSMNELSFPLLLLFEILILSPSSWRKKNTGISWWRVHMRMEIVSERKMPPFKICDPGNKVECIWNIYKCICFISKASYSLKIKGGWIQT